MQILSAEKIRAWDEFTIQHEPISSIDLMERAAGACLDWLSNHEYLQKSFSIYCGKGNNGGDGLALARMLSAADNKVVVHILEFGYKGTSDFQVNLARLHETSVEIKFIQTEANFHLIPKEDIIIDALYGTGLNRPLEGVTAALVEYINLSGNEIISIDIPSGLYSDKSSLGIPVIRAKHTLSFQCYKLAFLMAENAPFTGNIHILDIGLHPLFTGLAENPFELLSPKKIITVLKPRRPFAHKGNFGHALLVAGSFGKMGAAILAARACLRSGTGLLTLHIPRCGYEIMQAGVPEAMVTVDADQQINTNLSEELSRYKVIGIGPGLGIDSKTMFLLGDLLTRFTGPLVIDADGLNLLAQEKQLLHKIPPYSVLTPHPKEFERLFGESADEFERIRLALEKASLYQIIIVLKGHHTFIALPGGKGYFNATGNPGMAKGGSGDVLTGMLTSFLSQGYSPEEASILGVYLHGLAGDLAAGYYSEQSMLPSDIINGIGEAFLSLT